MKNMARKIMMAFLCMISMAVNAGDNLLVFNDVVWTEEGGELLVNLINEDVVNGVQFDITFPEGITVAVNEKGEEMVQECERVGKMSALCRRHTETRYRVMLFSMTGKSVRGHEGVLLRIPLVKSDAVKKGTYDIIVDHISLSVLVDMKNVSYPIEVTTAKLQIK